MFGVGWGANQFSSLLVGYHEKAGLSVGQADALFGIYAVGLVPALLVGGPFSDRRGRAGITRAAALTSVVASVVLLLGQSSFAALFVGRLLAGIASGSVFAAGTAWVKELSRAPYDETAGPQTGARRSAIALSSGFGLGPLVAGLVAQWAPHPLLVAYLPHLAVMAVVLPLLWLPPETVARQESPEVAVLARLRVPAALRPRFVRVVAPSAPWVFVAPSVAFALVPGLVTAHTGGWHIAFAAVSAGLTLSAGVLVQPVARRLDRADDVRGLSAGLATVTVGLALAAVSLHVGTPALTLVADVVLGAGYGLGLVSGLLESERIAAPHELAGLTAVFYALTYVGFATPLVVTELERLTAATTLLAVLAALAIVTLVTIRTAARSPAVRVPPPGDPRTQTSGAG
jgi:MFS family permease